MEAVLLILVVGLILLSRSGFLDSKPPLPKKTLEVNKIEKSPDPEVINASKVLRTLSQRQSNQQQLSSRFLIGVITAWIAISLIWGIGSNGRHEGATAEEWFNETDYYSAVLENYKSYEECVEDEVPRIEYYCSP